MNKTTLGLFLLAMTATLAAAISFTDVDKAKNHGKTGLKNLTEELDANFASIESGQFVQSVDTNEAGIKIQSASVTMHAGTVYTGTYATAFSAGTTPIVVATYTEDPGDVQPLYVTTDTNVGFTVTVTADKNFNWIAIGQ